MGEGAGGDTVRQGDQSQIGTETEAEASTEAGSEAKAKDEAGTEAGVGAEAETEPEKSAEGGPAVISGETSPEAEAGTLAANRNGR